MTTGVTYTIGPADELTSVNDGWYAFARDNGGDALLTPAILGRSIWEFITDESTRAIYRRLFDRVRSGGGPVRFSIRCDAPDARRALGMEITLQSSGHLRLATEILAVTPRTPVAVMATDRPVTSPFIRMCAWCQRIPDATGRWVEVEAALATMGLFDQDAAPRITHGMCDTCSRAMHDALDHPAHPWRGIALGGPTAPEEA